jgi:hypothetical protein
MHGLAKCFSGSIAASTNASNQGDVKWGAGSVN